MCTHTRTHAHLIHVVQGLLMKYILISRCNISKRWLRKCNINVIPFCSESFDLTLSRLSKVADQCPPSFHWLLISNSWGLEVTSWESWEHPGPPPTLSHPFPERYCMTITSSLQSYPESNLSNSHQAPGNHLQHNQQASSWTTSLITENISY